MANDNTNYFTTNCAYQILKKINIQRLKVFATENLPKDSLMRELLLTENDEIDTREFLGKIEIWIKLLSRV